MFGIFLNESFIGSVIEINHICYHVVSANNHSNDSVSLINPENCTYLRHRFGVLFPSLKPEQQVDDPNFDHDSSFIPDLVLKGFILRCSNPGFEKLFVSKNNEKLIIGQTDPVVFSPFAMPRIGEKLEFLNQVYIICPANNGKKGAFSLKQLCGNSFLRHSFGVITCTLPNLEQSDQAVFNDDSSFIFCPVAEGVRLRCSNHGLSDHYIAVNSFGEAVIESESEINASLLSETKSEFLSELNSDKNETKTNNKTEVESLSEIEKDSNSNHTEINRNSGLKYAVARIFYNRSEIITEHCLNSALAQLSAIGTNCSELRIAISDFKNMLQDSLLENQKLKSRVAVLENLASSMLNRKHRGSSETPLISVIVPVFNGETYLRACLNSLLSQTLADFELIIVNDGSTDRTEEILNEYRLRDHRIKIIATAHIGAGEARNRGLKEIKGKYVSILDADDIYDPRMLLTLYAAAEAGSLDITVCRSEKITEDDESTKEKMSWTIADQDLPKCPVFSSADAADHIFQLFNGWTWDKLFSAEFISSRRLKFQNTPFSNDAYFTYMALCSANRIGTVNEYLVTHRYHRNSIEAGRRADPVRFIDVFRAILGELENSGKMKIFGLSFCNWVISFSRWQYETLDESCRKQITDAVSVFMDENRIKENLTRIYREADTLWLANHIGSPVPEVSVIMPVFNSEKYLEEAVRSIREQTMNNFEVICIDDGSTDGSWNILQKTAEEDRRFRIEKQENSGAGTARNRGLELARGRYLAFMDSDDICDHDFLAKMLARARRLDTDVTVCRYIRFFDEHNTEDLPGNDIDLSLLPGKEVFSLQDIRKDFFQIFIPVVWNKLFRHELIEKKKIRFQEIRNSNDTFFVYCALLESASITTVNERLIRYRMRADSLVRTRRDVPDCYLLAQRALKEKVESLGLMDDEEFRKSLDLRIARNTEWNRKMASVQ